MWNRIIRWSLCALLLSGGVQTTSANGASVIATDPKSFGIQIDGLTVETDVTLTLPTTDGNEYACLALMSNYKWAVNSIDDILTLSEQLCYGEKMLSSTDTQQKVTIPILMEQSGFRGSEEDVYVQAYIIEVGNRKLLVKGDFVKVDQDKLRNSVQNLLPSNQDMENAVLKGVLGGMLESVFGGGTSTSDPYPFLNLVTCSRCDGNGKCYRCKGTGVDNGDECSYCGGYGKCDLCCGTGYHHK